MSFLGYPIYDLFLYFIFYSFLGWVMETCYCSICERRLVPRGFLYGPICPIYGTGVLLMILFFTPLKRNLVLFYVVAVAVMSSWEYFVAWLLETTTHVKYWDYSRFHFNLKGRICLWVALVWGILSYIVIFYIHPPIDAHFDQVPLVLKYALCGVLLITLLADAALTIRHLALVSKLVVGVTTLGEELQVQLSLGKAELSGRLEPKTEAVRQKYYAEIAKLERSSRRFRSRYSKMAVNHRYTVRHEDIVAAAHLAREELRRRKQARRAKR
ncbi:MAG: putative ABC transporter permease [Oscillospiraceae bacterium]|nr:putative ABC transporter permease [Oscillospiraceae bacterium]